eukprot:TCONS_00009422-protein
MSVSELNFFVEQFFKIDEGVRKEIVNDDSFYKHMIPTGSLIEGAFLVPLMIPVEGKNFDIDAMFILGEFSKEQANKILMETEYPGYYLIHTPLPIDIVNKEQIIQTFSKAKDTVKDVKIFNSEFDLMEFTKKGCPALTVSAHEFSDMEYNINDSSLIEMVTNETMLDFVFCFRLNFWPDITTDWFERQRYWPDLETMCDIREARCLLVRKSVGDQGKTWRVSLSEAEVILASKQSPFQKKSYLLAKLIFTLNTHGLVDSETGRKLSSYLLKTVYLFTLENTPPEEIQKLEEIMDYLQLAYMIFEKLTTALKIGYLQNFFVPEMNLLFGFGQTFLDHIGKLFDDLNFKNETFISNLVEDFKKNQITEFFSEFDDIETNMTHLWNI